MASGTSGPMSAGVIWLWTMALGAACAEPTLVEKPVDDTPSTTVAPPLEGTPGDTPEGTTDTPAPTESSSPDPTLEPTMTPGPASPELPSPTEPPGPTPTPQGNSPAPLPSVTPGNGLDQDGDGYTPEDGDCDDADPSRHPDAEEMCDGIDNDCDGEIEPDPPATLYGDGDGDGYGDASTAIVACGTISGFVSNPLDCNDADPLVYPGTNEVCNESDDDCDLEVDEGVTTTCYRDADEDGYGSASTTLEACAPPSGYVLNADDCKDTNDTINPGATEVCNEIDDDCDGEVDEDTGLLLFADTDGDGYGDPEGGAYFCSNPSSGYAYNGDDCDDGDPLVYPGAEETCNGRDDDCDDGTPGGGIDEDGWSTYYQDLDQDGYGNPEVTGEGCAPPEGFVEDNTDCRDTNDAISPAQTEIANGVDDNCDGEVDEGVYFPNCNAIKQAMPDSGTGIFFIDTDGADGVLTAEEVYCDMELDGGGWTLVASNALGADLLPSNGQALFISTPGFNRNPSPDADYLVGPQIFTIDFNEAATVASVGSQALVVRNTAILYPYVSPIEYSYEILQDDFGMGVCLDQARYFVLGCKEKDLYNDGDNNQNTTGACIVYDPSGDPSLGVSFGLGTGEGSYEGYQDGDCVSTNVDFYATYVR